MEPTEPSKQCNKTDPLLVYLIRLPVCLFVFFWQFGRISKRTNGPEPIIPLKDLLIAAYVCRVVVCGEQIR